MIQILENLSYKKGIQVSVANGAPTQTRGVTQANVCISNCDLKDYKS